LCKANAVFLLGVRNCYMFDIFSYQFLNCLIIDRVITLIIVGFSNDTMKNHTNI
jgi:hypothetical protein